MTASEATPPVDEGSVDEGADAVSAALDRLATVVANEATARTEARIPGIVDRFTRAGVDTIVLKGPVTRRRLYAAGERRPVADIDVLVDPRAFRRASRTLESDGYRRVDRHGHSDAFARDADDPDVDLHLTLPYVRLSPRRAWAVFAAHRTELEVGDGTVAVLDAPAHVVHLAIHAAVNRFESDHRSLDEWRRGRASLDMHDETVAASVAARLGVAPVWDLAVRALDDDASRSELVAALPAWEAVPRMRSVRKVVRSGTPLWVKRRDLQRLVALQLSDDTLNKWRRRRGRSPLPAGSVRIRLEKPVRLVSVSISGLARIVGFRRDDGDAGH